MSVFYRTMKMADDGLPLVGRTARTLGVRVSGAHADVHPDDHGDVHPRQGGMSVTVDKPERMPPARRPTWIGRGLSEDPLFAIDEETVPSPLAVRVDAGAHALVEPAVPQPLADYERHLEDTRESWVCQSTSGEDER